MKMKLPDNISELPRIEFSRDNGATWELWCYSCAGQTENRDAIFERLLKLYPEWRFRKLG